MNESEQVKRKLKTQLKRNKDDYRSQDRRQHNIWDKVHQYLTYYDLRNHRSSRIKYNLQVLGLSQFKVRSGRFSFRPENV